MIAVQHHIRMSRGIRKVFASLIPMALVVTALAVVQVATAPPAQAAPGDPFDPTSPMVFIGQDNPSQLQRAETNGDGGFVFADGAVPGRPRGNLAAS